MLRNKVNNKMYIGQTQQADIKNRWKAYKNLNKTSIGEVLFRALTKHGLENFEFKIICICFNEDCNKYEIECIKKYNSKVPTGYNVQDGGINKIRKPLTEEQKKNLPKRDRTGINNSCYGKPRPQEVKERASRTMKMKIENGTYVPRFDILKLNWEKCKKKVIQYDKNMNFIAIHESLQDAAKAINSTHCHISNCARGIPHHKTHKGFIWKFAEAPIA